MNKIVMILTNRYDPDVRVYKEAKYLVENGFEVEILCWDRESHYPHDENVFEDGIKITRFYPNAKYGSGLKQIFGFLKFIKEVKHYLKNKDINYIHCHDLDGAIVGNIVKKGRPELVFDMHEYYEVQGSKQKIRKIVRIVVNLIQTRFDHIIYVNPEQTKNMKKKNQEKLVYLPNYPEVENYTSFLKESTSTLKISYIGAVRQFNELKNLILASKGIPNVEVAIHGEGVAYSRLNELSKKYKNVKITGVFKHHQSGQLFSECDVLYAVYPTHSLQNRIAYPVKFFEAIASKTPLIVSKGTILEEELKKNDIGFAVDGENIEEIEELIKYLVLNKDSLENKTANIEKIQEKYQWSSVVKNLDYIYSEK
ncbi:glycosyltransferase [Planococcus ruber]|uniref:glycosyltransferase n=1 Tax=Planococcus ruber TaxID=2027871 RepID=UPI001FF05457|nr:glycosyltransferase [Planococcus ruber]MCJ1908281.1 glycosyltransferase [Planococcus ruber]